MNKLLFFLIALFYSFLVMAEGEYKEKEYYDQAVKETQNLLVDKHQREKAIRESPDAQKAADRVKQLSPDSKTEDEYYKLASEIFGGYSNEESMKKSISDGQRDPAQFYKSLTPEQKAKVKELSEKLTPGAGSNP